MQTTSPQGRNQEAGPLTQAEGEGGGSAEQCKLWPYEAFFGWGGMSAGQTGQIDELASTGLLKFHHNTCKVSVKWAYLCIC